MSLYKRKQWSHPHNKWNKIMEETNDSAIATAAYWTFLLSISPNKIEEHKLNYFFDFLKQKVNLYISKNYGEITLICDGRLTGILYDAAKWFGINIYSIEYQISTTSSSKEVSETFLHTRNSKVIWTKT